MKKASNHPLGLVNSTKKFTAWGLCSTPQFPRTKHPDIFSFFFENTHSMWNPVPLPETELVPLALDAQTVNHWTAREGSRFSLLFSGLHISKTFLPPSLLCTAHPLYLKAPILFAMLLSCSSFPDSCYVLVGSYLLHSSSQRSFFS